MRYTAQRTSVDLLFMLKYSEVVVKQKKRTSNLSAAKKRIDSSKLVNYVSSSTLPGNVSVTSLAWSEMSEKIEIMTTIGNQKILEQDSFVLGVDLEREL
jgi:hypothetical protein